MKRTLLFFFSALFLFWPALSEASFDDVPSDHRNFQGVSYLELQGAVDDGENFRPDDTLNRAEIYKILFKVFGETGEGITPSSTFSDVPKDAWFAPYVELALQYDLVFSSQREFGPTKKVSRADALKALFRIYGIPTPIVRPEYREPLYKDVSIQHPRYSLIAKAVELQIVEADENLMFLPYQNITRGDLADLIFALDQWYVEQHGNSNDALGDVHKSEIIADIWRRIVENFYQTEGMEIDEEALFQAAVKGIVESLDDPYSVFFPAATSDSFVEAVTGEFVGIGVYLIQDDVDGSVFITDFVAGSNAKEVGLRVGDEIEEVNGESIAGLPLEQITAKIKGEVNTTVQLTIRRNGSTETYTIERRSLKVTTEEAEIIENDIWYLDINLFTKTNFIEVNTLLEQMEAQVLEPRAIIIDLRSNGGGYINSALSIAGHFIENSDPVVQMDYGDYVNVTRSQGSGEYGKFPIYVLVDAYSASASEIVAAALREQAGAKLVGVTTFGKGTAQQVTNYWDGSILKLTIAQWLTSEGEPIQGVGLEPDIEITGTSGVVDLWLDPVLDDLE
ncbi:MAG: S41 family peptidase [Patescibacteria group bacterium]